MEIDMYTKKEKVTTIVVHLILKAEDARALHKYLRADKNSDIARRLSAKFDDLIGMPKEQ